eukprot:37884_1
MFRSKLYLKLIMGGILSTFCSREAESEGIPSNTDLKQRNAAKIDNTLEEEKTILNNMILDLTQKLASQQMENKLLKQELNTLNAQNIQNTEDDTHKDEESESLQKQVSVTNQPVFDAGIAHSAQSANVFNDPIMLMPTPDNMSYARSVPIPAISNGQSNPSEKVINSADKIETEARIHDTLETAATVHDVSQFVRHKYQTVGYGDSLSDDAADQEVPDNISENSSLDSEEQVKINEAKALFHKTQSVDDELIAVQQEMNSMRKSMITVTTDDIMRGTAAGMDDEMFIPTTQVTNNDEDVLDLPESNLLRFGSKNDWDKDQIVMRKKEMEAAMAHLVQHHVNTSTSTPLV